MEDRIKIVISQVLNISPSEITDDFTRDSADNWDSINQLTIVVALEEEFGVEFNDEQISQLLSFKLINIILNELSVQ